MGLKLLWQNSRAEIEGKHIQQIIAFAGQGKLQDESKTSQEFREFLKQVPSEILGRYADECLTSKFDDSGFALQDVVNQIGQRLGFQVEYGRYRGTRTDIGHDGLWRFPDGHSVVVEVKTTDKFGSASKIADYRKKLIVSNAIDEDRSSILIVVGRQDTGDLEAQVRGSRHAWDIRIISGDALIRLVSLKEAAGSPETGSKIRSLLIPKEYTRLDGMIDVMFTTGKDVEDDSESETESEDGQNEISEKVKGVWQFTKFPLLQAKRDDIVAALSRREDANLIKKTRALYLNPAKNVRAVCTISKRYPRA